jgi:hypothetical protein
MKIYENSFILSLSSNYGKSTNVEFIDFINKYNKLNKNIKNNNIRFNKFNKKKECEVSNDKSHPVKEKIILVKSENAWGNKNKEQKDNIQIDDYEKSMKKIKGLLNKITSDNYKKLIEKLKIQLTDFEFNNDMLINISDLILKKIYYDNKFHDLYINISKTIWSIYPPFKKILLNNCQKEFINIDNYINEYNNEIDEEEKDKINRKILGTIEFISHLYICNSISKNIIQQCVLHLVNFEDDKHVESLKKLKEIVGFDKLDKELIFFVNNKIIEKLEDVNISSRIRFMLEEF